MKRDAPVLDVDLLPRLAEELTAILPEPQAAARLKARILARVAVEAKGPRGAAIFRKLCNCARAPDPEGGGGELGESGPQGGASAPSPGPGEPHLSAASCAWGRASGP
jgi:hypothetical protein